MNKRKLSYDEDGESKQKSNVEDQLLFCPKISSLKDLCCTKIIAQICCIGLQKGMQYCTNRCDEDEPLLCTYVTKSLCHLEVPIYIRDMLKTRIGFTMNKLKEWSRYQCERKILYKRNNELIDLFTYFVDDIAWKSDGDIDYHETASRMLHNANTNELERFKILSVYCMAKEIRAIKFSRLKYKCELYKTNFSDEALVCYWYRFLRGDLPKLYASHNLEENSILEQSGVDNIHAVMYFWKQLDYDEQLATATRLIHKHGLKFQKGLLMGMRESQRFEICMKIGGEVIVNFANDLSCFNMALSSWALIKDVITETEFLDLLRHILERGRGSPFAEFLHQMWQTMPDRLKYFSQKTENAEVINLLTNADTVVLDMRNRLLLLLQILPNIRAEKRRGVFDMFIEVLEELPFRVFDILVDKHQEPWILDKLLNLCVPSAQERAAFRKQLIRNDVVISHCIYLWRRSEWDIFDGFVALYFPDVTSVDEFKIQLLKSKEGTECCLDLFEVCEYESAIKIIDNVFPQATAAENARKDLLLSDEAFVYFHRWLQSGRFRRVADCLQQFLASEEHVKIVKKRIAHFYASDKLCEIVSKFEESRWNEFQRWLSHDDNQVLYAYKRSLPTHDIFSALLADFIDSESETNDFSVLNRFLNWCFESSKEVNDFKIKEIFEFEKIPCINNMIFWYDCESIKLPRILRWCFAKHDLAEIRRFKSVYAHHEIVSLLTTEIISLYHLYNGKY